MERPAGYFPKSRWASPSLIGSTRYNECCKPSIISTAPRITSPSTPWRDENSRIRLKIIFYQCLRIPSWKISILKLERYKSLCLARYSIWFHFNFFVQIYTLVDHISMCIVFSFELDFDYTIVFIFLICVDFELNRGNPWCLSRTYISTIIIFSRCMCRYTLCIIVFRLSFLSYRPTANTNTYNRLPTYDT